MRPFRDLRCYKENNRLLSGLIRHISNWRRTVMEDAGRNQMERDYEDIPCLRVRLVYFNMGEKIAKTF
jgi:hypothetical protein